MSDSSDRQSVSLGFLPEDRSSPTSDSGPPSSGTIVRQGTQFDFPTALSNFQTQRGDVLLTQQQRNDMLSLMAKSTSADSPNSALAQNDNDPLPQRTDLVYVKQLERTIKHHEQTLQNIQVGEKAQESPKKPSTNPRESKSGAYLEPEGSVDASIARVDETGLSRPLTAEHIDSQMEYWCQTCFQYIGGTELERQHHETTLQHAYNFQESLSRTSGNGSAEENQHRLALRSSENAPSLNEQSAAKLGTGLEHTGKEYSKDGASDRPLFGGTGTDKPFEKSLDAMNLLSEEARHDAENEDYPQTLPSYSPITMPTGTDRLEIVLKSIDRQVYLQTFLDQGVNDLWFPFSKQTLRPLLNIPGEEKLFLRAQEGQFLYEWATSHSLGHRIFEDGEDILQSERILGEGGFAIVEQIVLPGGIACVRKRIGRTRQFKAQKQLMTAFAREISIMRQVSHCHCVEFLGSYTDHDNVAIILSPVADMDLATLLDLEHLDDRQERILRQGIGCLCNALLYLHDKRIRHEDLKPQNVLIHGENILLTDFGFSLDFSDDSVSTTTGRPMHWTARYSAPETMDHQPRNRATDIWGLGCILLEMVSCLYGHRISSIRQFWKQNGNGHPSFAMNEDALRAWSRMLDPKLGFKDCALFRTISTMLQANRLLRPTCQQVIDKLADNHMLFPQQPALVGHCCAYEVQQQRNDLLVDDSKQGKIIEKYMPLPPAYYFNIHKNYAALYADVNFNIIGYQNAERFPLPKPQATPTSPTGDIRNLFTPLLGKDDITKYCVHLMNKARVDVIQQSEMNIAMQDEALRQCYTSSFICPMKDMVSGCFRELFNGQLTGSDQYPNWRLVHLSFMPICMARAPLHGAWFFRLSFMLDEEQVEEHELQYKEWMEELAESRKTKLFFHESGSVEKWDDC
ncbi:kinase-like domain-containing protein [Lophiotrema nucula]|uniref:non-specific serine/threonine protein kinase n=1 Tax=Lophiotrema nucula TaxID=690887 RepID=A0A6A5YWC5_9PLEO|nr:kinase-like domain-containing protein [Lophiotrema nucula]